MRKIFIILMLSVFSIVTAHPFKSEKELYEYYAEIDKKIFTEKNKPIIRKKYPRKLTDKELEQEQIPFSLKRYTVDEIVGNHKLVYNAFNYQLMSISQINENNKEELAKITTKDFSLNKVNKTSPKKNEEILKKIEKIDAYSNLEESSSFNIENDKATLTVKKASTSKKEKVNNIEGKELKLEFKKVNNKWLIDKTEETIF